MRFWYAPFPAIHGVIIKRSGKDWSASFIRQREVTDPSSAQQQSLQIPESGWENVWQRLKDEGILVLPDGTKTSCEASFDDIAYVVETNVDRKYRTYWYSNPSFCTGDEAKRIVAIEKTIREEFQLASLK